VRFKKTTLGIILFLFVNLVAHADFGNWFVANKRLSIALDSSEKLISYRFTCQEDMSLSAFALYCSEAIHPPGYMVSLQEDKGGLPSGVALASSTYVPRAQSWSVIHLDPVPLLTGKVYHLVVRHDRLRGGGHPVGLIGPSNYSSFLTTDVLNHLHPNNGSPDPQSNTLLFEKGAWKLMNQEPVYAIYGVGSKYQGNPYDDPGVRPIFGKTLQGQVLHFHCAYTAQALAFRVRKQGNPASPLNYQILVNDYRAHKCTPFYSSTAFAPNQVSSNFQWVTVGLPPQIQKLFRAECWYFVFQTDSGRASKDPPGCEDCYVLSDEGNSGGLANASDLTFDGGPHLSRATCSVDGGDPFHWIDEFERDANVGAIGPTCPPSNSAVFNPIPTPIFLGNEPRFDP